MTLSDFNVNMVKNISTKINQTVEHKTADSSVDSVNKKNFDTVSIRPGDDHNLLDALDNMVNANSEKLRGLFMSSGKSSELMKIDSIASDIATGNKVSDADSAFLKAENPELLDKANAVNEERLALLSRLSKINDKVDAAKMFLYELQENKNRLDTDAVQISSMRAKAYQNAWINYLTGSEITVSNTASQNDVISEMPNVEVRFVPAESPMSAQDIEHGEKIKDEYYAKIERDKENKAEYFAQLERDKANREQYIAEMEEREKRTEEYRQELLEKQQKDEYNKELAEKQGLNHEANKIFSPLAKDNEKDKGRNIFNINA